MQRSVITQPSGSHDPLEIIADLLSLLDTFFLDSLYKIIKKNSIHLK